MDWNNINRDRDTSGLGPIEYDQSKVPALIRKHADNVRTKTYGQEVREAQARNAEVAGLIANEGVDISNETKGRQDIVETQFNSVQQELTDKDVISAPEIIAARNGEATLHARITKDKQKLDEKIAQNAINPDDFEGSDFEKVQKAIDVGISEKRSIRLWRVYDISGHTLKLGQTKRVPLIFDGVNKGGLKKTDNGFMFDSDLDMVSDFIFNNVFFESTNGSGVKVLNADKILVVKTNGCTFRYVDTFVYTSDNGFVQSYRLINDQAIGGMGAFYDIAGMYDVLIDGGYYENREDVFVHKYTPSNVNEFNVMNKVRILNSIFQSVRDAVTVRGTRGITIDENYFEGNQNDIVFLSNEDGFDYGIVVSNNGDYGKTARALVIWGRNNRSSSSFNNYTQFIPLHDFSSVEIGGIIGFNDHSAVENIGNDSVYFNTSLGKQVQGGVRNGIFSKYKINKLNVEIPNNSTQSIEIECPVEIETDDLISVQLMPQVSVRNKFRVNYKYRRSDSKKIIVINISNENVSESPSPINLYISVFKMYPTI